MRSVLVEALNGNALIHSVPASFNQAEGVWTHGLTLAFVATSAATTLRFTDQMTSENTPLVNWGLDNVTVKAVPCISRIWSCRSWFAVKRSVRGWHCEAEWFGALLVDRSGTLVPFSVPDLGQILLVVKAFVFGSYH